jgi:hypothetical protein
MDNIDIHNEKVCTGQRTYFFDIKKNSKGDYYLKIAESKKIDKGDYEKHQVMILGKDVERFVAALKRAQTKLNEIRNPKEETKQDKEKKAYSIDTIRQTYPSAYKPWTKDDDEKLELLFCEGKTLNELVTIFGRNEGAISSRINKLELNEKYNP